MPGVTVQATSLLPVQETSPVQAPLASAVLFEPSAGQLLSGSAPSSVCMWTMPARPSAASSASIGATMMVM